MSRFFLPILSGILIGTSYIPFYPWALFFCFIPLWIHWLRHSEPADVFKAGWAAQFAITIVGFNWIAETAREHGHLPWPVSIIVLLVFCSFANLHIPIAGWVWAKWHKRFPQKPVVNAVIMALLVGLGEIFFPMIFPWHNGYPWIYAGWPGMQWGDIIGLQGLSVFTLLINAYLFWVWSIREQKQKAFLAFFLGCVAFFIFNFMGFLHQQKWKDTDAKTTILSVQANIGNLMKQFAEKGGPKATQFITDKHFSLSRQALKENPDTDFLIWPETAYPDFLNGEKNQNRPYSKKLREFVAEIEKPLITGGYGHILKTRQTLNGIYYLNPEGEVLPDPYFKTILLAFGEYFPGADTFPMLRKLVPTISNFGRGNGPQVTRLMDVDFGSQICYEGLYPEFSRELAKKGAQVFVNVTNDSWFGRHFEPYQHLYMTIGRVIENRRPLMRSTNTGYTTAILADGSKLQFSPLKEEWYSAFEIKYQKNPELTFFTRYGHWLEEFFLVLTLLLLIGLSAKKREDS